ncbi:MAG: class I SAM-dependent methyltransferase [Acidimicrobiales bacterium]
MSPADGSLRRRPPRVQGLRATVLHMLTGATARLAARGPVIVPEFDLHPRARYGWDGHAPLSSLVDDLEAWAADHRDATVSTLLEVADWCGAVPMEAGASAAGWDNEYWGSLDAVWQVAELRRRDPARYIEIGSGYSTPFARRAIESFSVRTRITSIDPVPRLEVDAACDEVLRCGLEEADLELFEQLEAGDIVVVDGSHVVAMNSDSVVLFLEVLPALRSGVLVGIDDVYLPWDYHPTWAERWYGEQYLLAAYLLGGGGGDRIIFPGWVMARALADEPRLDALWRSIENRFGRLASSFWFERDTVSATDPSAVPLLQ